MLTKTERYKQRKYEIQYNYNNTIILTNFVKICKKKQIK